jgi:hypothetical protein
LAAPNNNAFNSGISVGIVQSYVMSYRCRMNKKSVVACKKKIPLPRLLLQLPKVTVATLAVVFKIVLHVSDQIWDFD